MLVKQYLIETRTYPTADQLDVLRRFGVNVGTKTNRRYFTARLTDHDAGTLRNQHRDFVKAVSENVEGTHCDA